MGTKIDRIEKINYNTFGSEMIIVEYRSRRDIDIYFPEYDWIAKHRGYEEFKKGNVKCPYERRTFGVGYLGEGEYKVKENGKETKCYRTWVHMLRRCYDEKYHEKHPTYTGCEVTEEWYNLQNFGNWFKENYYEIEGQRMDLDKDILIKHNKIYSPDTCVFVPQIINLLFVKCDNSRGDYPIGVSYHKRDKKFRARCSVYDFKENKSKSIYLGYYEAPNKAFEEYKKFKEQNIKEVTEYYKEQIPSKLYDALYNYKVEITD